MDGLSKLHGRTAQKKKKKKPKVECIFLARNGKESYFINLKVGDGHLFLFFFPRQQEGRQIGHSGRQTCSS